jgi:Predicted transcriptional regulators
MEKKTRFVILGLLRDEAMTGYEMKHNIDLRMSFFWNESYGQIYPELVIMLEEGLIEEETNNTINKRSKNYYRITQKGRAVFNAWMAEDNEKDTIRSEALLKFFLADDCNKKDVIKHLKIFYQENEERALLYQRFTESLLPYSDLHNNHKYILKMLELGSRQQELYCSWAEEYRKELEEDDK